MSAAEPRPAPVDCPVLVGAPLRPGFGSADLPRYDDPVWDLGPAVFRENARRCGSIVRFDAIEDAGVREVLRAFLHARLNLALPGRRAKLPPASLRIVFHRTRVFLEFVRARRGAADLRCVDQALLDAYARHLHADKQRRASSIGQLLAVVVDFHLYRRHLPSSVGLAFEPWLGRSPFQVAGYHDYAGENRTPRIPEAVIEALLAWSLRYVADFAPEILAARAELDRLEACRDALVAADAHLGPRERLARRCERLAAFFERRRREGRGVPVWANARAAIRRDPLTGAAAPPVNYHLLSLHVGLDSGKAATRLTEKGELRCLIAAAVAELGVEVGGLDTPVGPRPDAGGPWRLRFDAVSLAYEERMLQAAAYIVCAYLTGMRDSEVQAMRRGCLTVARSQDGLVTRYRVRSVAYKGSSGHGKPEEWVTVAQVAEAVHVLERLSARAAGARDSNTLWPILKQTPRTKNHLSVQIVFLLNAFRNHLDALFGTPGRPAVPTGPGGQPWRLTTRQFRRTVAWHIANRPFGTVAGMIQYKHASVAAFEGYAGASASGFRAEVEEQRALGQLDDILAYFDERQAGAPPSGPAGPRVTRALDATAEALGPLPGAVAADRGRLRALLADLARTLHVGVLADCFFDPATALCLKQTAARAPESHTPLVALCQPTRCPNACVTARHRPAWMRAAEEARVLLREKRLSGPQRTALEGDLARFEHVLAGIKSTAEAGGA